MFKVGYKPILTRAATLLSLAVIAAANIVGVRTDLANGADITSGHGQQCQACHDAMNAAVAAGTLDSDGANANTRRAALATAGRILTYNGRPAEVFYSASCGGATERAADVWPGAELPYLQSVPDGDVHADDRDWTAISLFGDEYKAYVESENVRVEAILKDLGLAS